MDCNATTFDPDTAEYVSAQGVLAYRFAQSVLFPRNNADISFIGLAGVNDGLPQRVSFSTYPNPARVAELRFALPKRGRYRRAWLTGTVPRRTGPEPQSTQSASRKRTTSAMLA